MSIILKDNVNRPSVMIRINKFYLDEISSEFSHVVHPAFIVNGIERDCFYVSKYINCVKDNRAYSIPMELPKTNINIQTASKLCKNKGKGWHLMTNAEWSAIQLLCYKNNKYPLGNNSYGKDHTSTSETGLEGTKDGSRTGITLTGSGTINWSHDRTIDGIYDLNGNVREFVDGLKLIKGAIAIKQDNNFISEDYKFVDTNGNLTSLHEQGVKVDTDVSGDSENNSHTVGGGKAKAILKPSITNFLYTADTTTNNNYGIIYPLFEEYEYSELNTNVINVLKTLGIFPVSNSIGSGDGTSLRNYGERICTRGGSYNNASKSGIFGLDLSENTTHSSNTTGFRCCYIDI